jgi:anti-anti-sigma regulatory factor
MAASKDPAHFHVVHEPNHGLALLEVEGTLSDAGVVRWAALLKGMLHDYTRLMVVDVRGCRAIEPHCLTVLLSVGAALRASGGSLRAVATSGSPIDRFLHAHDGDLPKYTSVQHALTAWREAF